MPQGRAVANNYQARSKEFLKARRSIRPIDNHSKESLWKGTGDFTHTALGIPDEDLSPEDIESVIPVRSGRVGNGHVRGLPARSIRLSRRPPYRRALTHWRRGH